MKSINLIYVIFGVLIFIQVNNQIVAGQDEMLPCPAVDPLKGTRPPLVPSPKATPITEKEGDREVVDEFYQKALQTVAFFEAGGKNPWSNINKTDVISMGFLQWNWNTLSLIEVLIKNTSQSDIGKSHPNIQNDIKVLKQYSDAIERVRETAPARLKLKGKEKDLRKYIDSKTTIEHNDSFQIITQWVNSREKTSYLDSWLKSQEMIAVQNRILRAVIQKSFFYARAWLRDTGSDKPLDARTVAYFFDLLTFNGGLSGIWVQQVKAFREKFNSKKEIVLAISKWLSDCNKYVAPTKIHIVNGQPKAAIYNKLYGITDSFESAKHWKEIAENNEDSLDENQVNLLILGLLKAQQANGDDAPNAFNGVYQANVLNRRGIIVIGGFINNPPDMNLESRKYLTLDKLPPLPR